MTRSNMVRISALLSLLALPMGACAVAEEQAATSSDDLRRLTPPEIVGSIAYGETKSVSYSSEPRYRALSFQATEGDKIDARFVGAKGLDTIGFLLSDSFATLTSNDDESANSRASHFTYEITKTGTYYLAVREANEEDGTIAITLSKSGTVTPPVVTPPTPPSDFFNPQSCTGAPLTQADAIQYFPKGSAGKSVTISKGPGKFYLRARTCSEFSGCSDWVEKAVTKSTDTDSGVAYASSSWYYVDKFASGIALTLNDRANNPIDVRADLFQYANSLSSEISFNQYVEGGVGKLDPKGAYRLLAWVSIPVAESNLNVVPIRDVDWNLTLNQTCAQARFSTVNISSGKQQRFELQGVAHWDLRAR